MSERKIALVTGGGRGIGRETCLHLARDGHFVVVNYSASEKQAQELVHQIKGEGGEAAVVKASVANCDEVEAMFAEVNANYGAVDILVNNAGILRDGLLARMKNDDFESVLQVNLMGTFYCTRTAIRDMAKKRWGRVINLSSVSGFFGNAGQANYAASKAALIGFTRSVARELGRRNVTVNAIMPGLVDTDAIVDAPQAAKDYMLSLTALNRMGEVHEVASLVAYLASENAGYITGAAIAVDGGMGAV